MIDTSKLSGFHPTFDDSLGWLRLVLDHGKANEIGVAELRSFEALCEIVEASSEVRCLSITSRRVGASGRPIFVAGANVTERAEWNDARVAEHVAWQRAIMVRLRRLPVFTTALVAGVSLGFGVELCLAVDTVLATSSATFGLPETGLGIVPGAGGTADLAIRVGVSQALRLGCTGEVIGADEARRIGLVDELVVAIDEGEERMRAIAEALARRSPSAVAVFKRAVLDGVGRPPSERLALERDAYESMLGRPDAALGRRSFAEIRGGQPPSWPKREP